MAEFHRHAQTIRSGGKAQIATPLPGGLEVLALLDLDGALVTADVLHCRPDIGQAIRDRNGH